MPLDFTNHEQKPPLWARIIAIGLVLSALVGVNLYTWGRVLGLLN